MTRFSSPNYLDDFLTVTQCKHYLFILFFLFPEEEEENVLVVIESALEKSTDKKKPLWFPKVPALRMSTVLSWGLSTIEA